MHKLLIYGAGEFGQVIKNLVQCCGYEFSGFIDDYFQGEKIIGTYDSVKSQSYFKEHGIVIAVGYKSLENRYAIYQKVKADGYEVPTLIHPQSIVDKSSRIGQGSIIMAGAIVDYNVKIKDLVVLWNGVVVSHDSVIGENTFLSPNATVCGFASIGKDCFIGASAVVTDHLKVPDKSFMKAGSVNELQKRHL